jgi:hypothetical protein
MKSASSCLSGDIISKYEKSSLCCRKDVKHFRALYKQALSSPFDILPLPVILRRAHTRQGICLALGTLPPTPLESLPRKTVRRDPR